jgi:hypothetical protein
MKKIFAIYLFFGALALVISIVLSLTLFAPEHGFPIDDSKAPAEVRKILDREPKGEPLTRQEMAEIDRLLSLQDPDRNQRVLIKTIKNGWILFVLIPGIFAAVCLVVARKTKKLLPLILLPSFLFISTIAVVA